MSYGKISIQPMHRCFDSVHIKYLCEKYEIATWIINVWSCTEILLEWGHSLVISEMDQKSQKRKILQQNGECSHIWKYY